MSTDWTKHLIAASGYLELGMITEAANEVEEIDPPDKTRFAVLAFRVDLFRAAKEWDGMATVARHLAKVQPDEPAWIINLAWAVRRGSGPEAAKVILEAAEPKFANCALLHYNLGCYACVEGDIATAKMRLQRAFELEPDLKLNALEDPDLELFYRSEKNSGVDPVDVPPPVEE